MEWRDRPCPCLARASATLLPSPRIWTQEQEMLWQKLMQFCHLALICQGTPRPLLKAMTTLRESVSKQICIRCISFAFSIANMQALNSASKEDAWPMLLEIAPRKLEWESLSTIPREPQGWLPMEEPSQLNFTMPSEGGLQTISWEGHWRKMDLSYSSSGNI